MDIVTPMEVRLQDPIEQGHNATFSDGQSHHSELLAAINLGNLTQEQRQQARKLLVDETESFSVSESDFGCIPDLQMNINLNNNQPVQQRYSQLHLKTRYQRSSL